MLLSRVFRRHASVLIQKASSYGKPRRAITHKDGNFSYAKLLHVGKCIAEKIPTSNSRVLVLSKPGPYFVSGSFATWISGNCLVPLCVDHTVSEMSYYADDSMSTVLLYDNHNRRKAHALKEFCPKLKLVELDGDRERVPNSRITVPELPPQTDPSLMIYTSGTTGKPKGVVHTHASIQNQIEILVNAWKWTKDDSIVTCLPLHHVHGLVNVLFCSLYVGAEVKFCGTSSQELIKSLTCPVAKGTGTPTLFMAVPSIYARLIEFCESLNKNSRSRLVQKSDFKKYRLMVSGSMALPPPIHAAWKDLTKKTLLERYGMTETGMVLSQLYNPDSNAEITTGNVGVPLPTVSVKLGPSEEKIEGYAQVGELLVKSPSLFSSYWNRSKATEEAFDEEGYFYTGDLAGVTKEGVYSILGRLSVDVLKSAGYKLSALEIETVLLSSPFIAEAAVVGIPDQTYGQVVGAVVVLKNGGTLKDVKAHCAETIAKYKQPRRYHVVDAIPRNTMGKINKKELVKVFE